MRVQSRWISCVVFGYFNIILTCCCYNCSDLSYTVLEKQELSQNGFLLWIRAVFSCQDKILKWPILSILATCCVVVSNLEWKAKTASATPETSGIVFRTKLLLSSVQGYITPIVTYYFYSLCQSLRKTSLHCPKYTFTLIRKSQKPPQAPHKPVMQVYNAIFVISTWQNFKMHIFNK